MPAQGSDAFFSFGTDFPQVAAQIIRTAEELGPQLQAALNSAGGGNAGGNLLKGLVGGVEEAGKLITDRVTALKGEIQRALVTGTAIPPGGLFGGATEAARVAATQLADTFTSTLRTLPANLQRTLGPQLATMAQELARPLANLASSAAVRAQGEILPQATSAGRLRDVLGAGTPGSVSNTVTARAQQEINSAMTKLAADLQRGEGEAQQAFNELAQFRQLTAEAVHNLRSNPYVAQGPNGRIAVTSPATGEQVVAGAGGFRVSGESEAETLQYIATAQRDALLTVSRAMEASAAATLRKAEAEQLGAVADQAAAEAAERKSRVTAALGQGSAYSVGASAAFLPGEGFVNPKTGALISDMNQVRVLTDQMAASFDRLAEAEAVAQRTPVDEFFRGLFGAGGRKYRGGARYDESSQGSNIFNGLAETAGVILKYEVLGTAFFKIFEDAKHAVEQLGLLDEAVAKYNEIVDAGSGSNTAFVNSLENLAQRAGELTTVALEEATRGVAAFSSAEDSASQRQQVGLDFAKYATQSQVISGGSTKENASDLISIGRAYELTASQLGDVTNAVANARKNLGADSQAVRQAMAIIAEGGREAGYSVIELASSLGEIQARTAESGEAVASAFQRVLALFQGGGAQGLIRDISETFRAEGKTSIADSLVSGDTKSRIQALASVFHELTDAQRQQLETALGGPRALKAIIPLLTDNAEIQRSIRLATENTNEAQKQQDAIVGSLAGQYRQFRQLVRNLALDIARSGIAEPMIIAFGVMKQILQLVDNMIQAFDVLPKPLREIPIVLGEAYLVMKGITALAASQGVSGALGIGRSVLATIPGGALLAKSAGFDIARTPSTAAASARIEAAAAEASAAIIAAGERIAEAEGAVAAARSTGNATAVDAAERNRAVVMAETNAAIAAATAEYEAAKAGEIAAVTEGGNEYSTALREQAAILRAEGESAAAAAAAAMEGPLAEFDVATVNGAVAMKTFAEATLLEAEVMEKVATTTETLATGLAEEIPPILVRLSELSTAVQAAAARIGSSAVGFVGTRGPGGLLGAGGLLSRGLANPLVGGIGGAVLGQALGGGTGGLLLGGAGAFLGLTNPVTIALAGGLAIKKALDTTSGVIDSINQSMKAQAGFAGTSADELHKTADSLRAAHDKIKESSGGFFGSIFGGATELFGGTNRGAEAAFDTRLAEAADHQATLLDDAKNKLQATFSSGGVDFSAVDGIKNALDGMSKNGATATDQLNAVNGALTALADAASAGARTLTPGQSLLVSTQIASGITQNVAGYAGIANDQFGTDGGLRGVNYANLTDSLNTDMEKYFSATGLDKGGQITVQEQKQAVAYAQAKLKEELEKVGIDYAKLPEELRNELDNAASLGVNSIVNHLNAANGVVTQDNVAQYLQALPQLATTAGQEAGTTASLSGGSGALTAAQTTLAQLQAGRAKAAAFAKGPQALDEIDQKIKEAELALQDATIQHIDAMGQLAQSLVSPFDAGGQIQAQLDTLQEELKNTTDKDKIAGIKAKINALHNQAIQQTLADQNSAIAAGADPRSQISQAQAAVDQAQNTLDTVKANGGTGQKLTDAQKALTDAQLQLANAQLDDANQMLEASVQYGNHAQELFVKAQELDAQAAATNDPGKKANLQRQASNSRIEARLSMDQTTIDYWRSLLDPRDTVGNAKLDLQADRTLLSDTPLSDGQAVLQLRRKIKEDKIALAEARAQLKDAIAEASVFPGDDLGSARVKLAEARRQVQNAKKGTLDYYKALADLHQAQVDLANAELANKDVLRQLSIDITDPVAEARDEVIKARQKLESDRRKGAPASVLNQDRLDLEKAQNDAEKTAFEQRLNDAKTNYDLGRTSFAAYLQYLESEHNRLSAIKHRTRQQQDELNEVDEAIKSANSELAGSQFNLGDIKLPTVYQSRRLAALNGIDIGNVNDTAGTGTVFGGPQDPTSVVWQPLKNTLTELSPVTTAATSNLTALRAAIEALGAAKIGAAAGKSGGGGVTHLTINGVDFAQVVKYINSVLGSGGHRSATTVRKVGV